MKITALAGGIGGARFLRGLTQSKKVTREVDVTVIANTGDDIWVHGVRVCPDLDTVMYTLGGGISVERGWGREGETFTAKEELAAYGVDPTWFGLGDKDLATHLIRTTSLNAGYTLSEVTSALCDRWQPGINLIPMSDNRCETHVVIDHPDTGARVAIHFQEWWIRYGAKLPAHEFIQVGLDTAQPAPGVIDAILNADLVLLPPSNPVVSIGTILAIPGMTEAIRNTSAPVLGLSPIVNNAPVRGMADACLSTINVQTNAAAVARHYGSRSDGGLLDYWLIDHTDADSLGEIEDLEITARAIPLLMTDVDAAGAMANSALDLALEH
ncbi:MAG: 2-phospho-L-lactate transferase [Candidatus Nanopelagicales bacterium]